MSDFRIDKLKLVRNGDVYNLTGECNSDSNTTRNVAGTYNALTKTMVFKPAAAGQGNDKIVFTANGVDFRGYAPDRMLELNFGFQNIPTEKRKKGGVVVVDTDYPPPIHNHQVFPTGNEDITKDFKIDTLTITRRNFLDTETKFDVSLELLFDSEHSSYTIDSGEIMADPSRVRLHVINLQFNVTTDGNPHTGNITFNLQDGAAVPMALKTYFDDGLVLLVRDKNTNWPDLMQKKALFMVE